MTGSDVNAVDRSPSGDLIASADDFGKVNLLRYPAIGTGPTGDQKVEYSGHSSHVTCVRWLTFNQAASKVQRELGEINNIFD